MSELTIQQLSEKLKKLDNRCEREKSRTRNEQAKIGKQLRQQQTTTNKHTKRLDNIDKHTIEVELDNLRAAVKTLHKKISHQDEVIQLNITKSLVLSETLWFLKRTKPAYIPEYTAMCIWAMDTLPDKFWKGKRDTTIAQWMKQIYTLYKEEHVAEQN